MPQPTPYVRTYDFQELRASGPGGVFPANLVDVEFNNVKITIDDILANLALIQRDDGSLRVELTTDDIAAGLLEAYRISVSDEDATYAEMIASLQGEPGEDGGGVVSDLDLTIFAANVIDTDVLLAADSDLRLATQKAMKAHVAAAVADVTISEIDGDLIDITNLTLAMFAADIIDIDGAGTANSDLRVMTQKAVRTLVSSLGLSGQLFKESVVVATTANGTLATAFENGDTVNGVVLATGNRILIKDQSAPAENGIYVVAASGAPTRATDCDSSAELVGATIPVLGGTVNPNTIWICVTPSPITVDTTALSFTQLPVAGVYTGGSGLTLTTNDFAVDFASAAEAIAGVVSDEAITPATLDSALDARVIPSVVYAGNTQQLTVVPNDDAFAAANATAVNAWFVGKTYTFLQLHPGSTTFGNTITVPATCGILGSGHNGSIMTFSHTNAECIRTTQLSVLRNLAIDSTAARKASATPTTCYGVIIGNVTGGLLDSTFQAVWSQVRVVYQPAAGVFAFGNMNSSIFDAIRTEECGEGFVIEDGVSLGVSAGIRVQPGIITLNHLRAHNNKGPGLRIGKIGDTEWPLRVVVNQLEAVGNCTTPSFCPLLQGPITLAANPIDTDNGSNIIRVVQTGGNPAIRGNYVTLAGVGAGGIGGITQAQLNRTHRVHARQSDTAFFLAIVDPVTGVSIVANADVTAGGGTGITVTHRSSAQAFIKGDNHTINDGGASDPFYSDGTTPNGTAKDQWTIQGGGIYFYKVTNIPVNNFRYPHLGYGAALDMAGAPISSQATSLSTGVHFDEYYSVNTAPPATHLFYIPKGATGCTIRGGAHTGSTNLVWSQEPLLRVWKNGIEYRGMAVGASPELLWKIGDTPSALTISAAGDIVADGDGVYVTGAAPPASDNLDSICTGAMPPQGYTMRIVNQSTGNIVIRHGVGNLYTQGGVDLTLTGNKARTFISAGSSRWVEC